MSWLAGLVCLLLAVPAVRADRSPTNCDGSALEISLFTSSPDVHVGDQLWYSINVFNGVPNSGRVACDATGITAFVVTPDGVTNYVTLLRTTLSQGQGDFYANVVGYVVRLQDIQPDGTLLATARDIGTIHQNIVNGIGGSFQAVNTEVNLPCLQISALCFGNVGQFGAISFTGAITNCGNDILINVTLTNFDDNSVSTIFFPTNLASHTSTTFSGSWVPLNPCGLNQAILTVIASDALSSTPVWLTNSATLNCQNTLTPGIEVTKACPVQPVAPGQLLTFSGSVSNTGNVTLTNIVVVDNQPAANTAVFTLASLAPGSTANFTGSYLAPANCSVSDTLVATAASICGVAVTNFASATCPIVTTPALAVTQNCPVNPVIPGGLLTYTGTVINAGNVTITNVLVFNNQSGSTPVFTAAIMIPGAVSNFSGSYVAPAGCTSTSTSTATGQSICGIGVTNAASTTCTITTTPLLVITQTCPVNPVIPGGLLTYSGTVSNAGNIMLTNIVVLNNLSGSTPVFTATAMAPGATANFTGSYVASANCASASTSTVTGESICGIAVTNAASTTCPITTTPVIVVTQVCPVNPVAPGGLLTYSGTVSNAGNIMLTNIVVLNNASGSTPIFTAATLAPGAVANFTGSYVAPATCSSTSTSTGTGRSICGVAVTNAASTTCTITTTPILTMTQNCPVNPVIPGGLLTYSGTVSNAGNIMLTNIVILNNLSGSTPIFTAATLAPGAVANFTGSYVAPAACSSTSISTGTGQSICGVAVTNAASTSCPITTTPLLVITQACPVNPIIPGGLLTYTGTVSNAGNIMLTNVVVLNNVSGSTPVFTAATMAPGAVSNFSGSYVAPANCSSASTSTATGQSICGIAVTNTASTTCVITTTPLLVITQACPVNPVVPGGLLTYTGTVSNAGNIMLTNVVVLNNLSGSVPIFTAATLAPGANSNFTGSYLAPVNCSSSSTSTATGRSICGVGVTNAASTTCSILTTPLIAISVFCPSGPMVPGATVTYSGLVVNAGNITLTNIVVVSSRPTSNTTVFTGVALAPGFATNFTGTFIVPTNACSVTTTFSGTGTGLCSANPVTNTVSTTCTVTTAPAIAVSLACPAIPAVTGGLITYSGTVSNSGNVTLNNVFVVNNQPFANTSIIGPLTLTQGATANFTASFTAPANACSVSSTVTATGADNCTARLVTNNASATCPLITAPGIAITQACPVNPASAGSLLTYSGTVSNSGNITLTNVVVLNNLSGSTPVFTIPFLAPGVVAPFTGSYLAPTNCFSTSSSTATAASICGAVVSNSVNTTCPVVTTPVITVTQVCPTNSVIPGGLLTYSGTVSNAGNITLTNIVVMDNRPGSNTVVFTLATLPVGATANFTGSYQVPLNCCVVWSTLTASGQGCAGITVSDTATRTCNVLTAPLLAVTKVCAPGLLHWGDLMTYSGIVSNAGNITMINVTVMNSEAPGGSLLLGPITLAPGESQIYTTSFIVPQDFCGADTVTASGLDICAYAPTTTSVTVSCPVIIPAPHITVSMNCPLLPTPRGGLFTFTGAVSNSGTISLVNVFVVDSMPSNNAPVIGPISLAPGAVVIFTNSYIAPTCCCFVLDILTATGQDHCLGSNATAEVASECPLLSIPSIAVVPNCPVNPIPMGSLYMFSGYVTNTGDTVLTNVFVFGPQGTNAPVLGPIQLAPGESETYFGTYLVPTNTCAVTVTTSGLDICGGTLGTNSASCPVATTPGIAILETCPPGPVAVGSLVTFGGSVINSGNITLANIFVFGNQPSNGTPVSGPFTLAPGASAPFTGSYMVLGGSNPMTNTTIVTNGIGSVMTNIVSTITTNSAPSGGTNVVTPTFGTIDPVSTALTDRFNVSNNLHGLMFANQNENWGPTLFYAIRFPGTSADEFDTISAAGVITDQFALTSSNYDALTLSAPDVGYGVNNFYYIRHDNLGVCTFGVIKAAGASSSSDLWVLGSTGYKALTFAAANLGYGANLFYFIRQDNTGLATFGTINPTPGGVSTDLYAVGSNFDALVFVPGSVSTWGSAIFAYLRHNATGSIIGTINPTTHAVTDQISLGTNLLAAATFAATDVGFGPNLFYYLRSGGTNVLTNNVTTFTTNMVTNVFTNSVITYTTNTVILVTATNNVSAIGMDVCQNRTVAAAANCLGAIGSAQAAPSFGSPVILTNGLFSLSFLSQNGISYTLQYKDRVTDPVWINAGTVTGTGGIISLTDGVAAQQPTRFFQIILTP
jgi:uncharacterized repeat protein (TIGR01451 family)